MTALGVGVGLGATCAGDLPVTAMLERGLGSAALAGSCARGAAACTPSARALARSRDRAGVLPWG